MHRKPFLAGGVDRGQHPPSPHQFYGQTFPHSSPARARGSKERFGKLLLLLLQTSYFNKENKNFKSEVVHNVPNCFSFNSIYKNSKILNRKLFTMLQIVSVFF